MKMQCLFSQEQSLHEYNQLFALQALSDQHLANFVAYQAPISLRNSWEDKPIFNWEILLPKLRNWNLGP